MKRERNLCGNCDHWREEHYGPDGAFIGEQIGCWEYDGINPDPARLKNREKELEDARAESEPRFDG